MIIRILDTSNKHYGFCFISFASKNTFTDISFQ